MIQPTQDWMVLKLSEQREKTLIIPETAAPSFADTMAHEVVAIGPWDVFPEAMDTWTHDVQVGDTVIVEGLNARSFQYNKELYFMARARDVIAIVNRQEKGSDAWKN